MTTSERRALVALAAVFTILATTASAHAAKKIVSANGADSLTCGTATSPCRSITQAIANAAAGDTIVVGPGIYGSIDNDGVIGEGGEETGGCGGGCLLEINKAVTVTSTDGPGATIINAPESLALNAAVSITAANAALGKPGKGFTIMGGALEQVFAAVDGVKIMGNRLIGSADQYGAVVQANNAVVRANVVIGGGTDKCISVQGDSPQIMGNLVSGCNFGLFVQATNWTMVGNVVVDNLSGLFVPIDVGVSDPPTKFLKNAFISNLGAGIDFVVTTIAPTTTVNLGSSNVFGNAPLFLGLGNCGIRVFNSDSDPLTVNADKFFWGAVTGPGTDPADEFCVSVGTATINATNPKPKPYPIKGPPQR